MDNRLTIRASSSVYKILDFDSGDLILSKTILHPNQSTRGHSHNYNEAYYFLDTGSILLDEEVLFPEKGEFVFIPGSTFHKVWNNSNTDLEFLCAWSKGENK